MANGNGSTGMNTSHLISAGSAVGFVTQALVYLTSWPWKPMDATSATPFAALLVMAFAPLISKWVNAAVAANDEPPNPTVQAAPPAVVAPPAASAAPASQ